MLNNKFRVVFFDIKLSRLEALFCYSSAAILRQRFFTTIASKEELFLGKHWRRLIIMPKKSAWFAEFEESDKKLLGGIDRKNQQKRTGEITFAMQAQADCNMKKIENEFADYNCRVTQNAGVFSWKFRVWSIHSPLAGVKIVQLSENLALEKQKRAYGSNARQTNAAKS